MSYPTHKRTSAGKAMTIERRQIRASKHGDTFSIGKRSGK